MKAILIKADNHYYLEQIPSKGISGAVLEGMTGSTDDEGYYKISKQNCDEIFGVVDVYKLADEYCTHEPKNLKELRDVHLIKLGFRDGFNKAMELNKDKVFTEFDIISAFEYGWNQRHFDKTHEDELREIQKRFIQSIQQPTEIEVEILTRPYTDVHEGFELESKRELKLDNNECLILKKI